MTPEELRDYWDALVTGSPVPETADPEFAATIHELHALDDAPSSAPSLMADVWRDLIGEPLATPSLVPLEVTSPAANGRRSHEVNRSGATAIAPAPGVWRHRLDLFLRADRLLAIGVMAGFGAGFVSGIGARLAMRVSGLLTDSRNRGLLTDNGNVVGEISFGGTLSIALFAGFVGILGGLLYVAIRSYLPGRGWRRGLGYGGLLLATFGFVVMDKSNPDYHLFGPPAVNVGTFSLVYVLFGLVAAPLADRLDRWFPAWPPMRPVRRRTIAVYVVLAPFEVIGLLAVVAGIASSSGFAGLIFTGLVLLPAMSLLGPRLSRRLPALPRPAFAGYLLLAAPSLIGLVLTVRAIAGILGAG